MEHSPDSCKERPADFGRCRSKFSGQFLPQPGNRIAARCLAITIRGGPTRAISGDTLGVPKSPHLEAWHRDFIKRKIQALITLFHHPAFLRPKVSNHPVIEILKNSVGRFVLEARNTVTPHGKDPLGLGNAAAFLPKSPEIQPVERLSHGNQIHAPGLQPTCFRGCQSPFDIREKGGVPQLGGAGIGGKDFIEPPRQFLGGLAAPAGAVPSQAPPGALGCEPVEPIHRIARAKFRVVQRTG